MPLTLVTAPASLPVTRSELKLWSRIDDSYEDALLDALIAEATAYLDGADGILARCLISQTWKLTYDGFSDTMELPLGPVTAVNSVKYYDSDSTLQTLSTDYYTVDLVSQPQWIVRNTGYSWPEVVEGINAVEIEFVAGYANAAAVPGPIKRAILAHAGHLFDHRDGGLPEGFDRLIAPLRTIPV